jgi:pimeloyl-ACP methyl ester carboxylesterase
VRSFLHKNAGLQFVASETDEGRPMFFQHGLCGDGSQPAEVFPSGIGWRCFTLDCRGHGQSETGPFEEISIATFTDDVASFIESQSSTRVAVGGISMGAAIALRLAVLRPDLVSALVLARPAWITEDAPANMHAYAVVGDLLCRYPPNEARTQFEALGIAHQLKVSAPDNLASLRTFFSREPISRTQELLCRISADGPGISNTEIESISVPTLIIGHARDLAHPLSIAEALAAMIPSSKFVEIVPKAEDREQYRDSFKAALSTFLKELPR